MHDRRELLLLVTDAPVDVGRPEGERGVARERVERDAQGGLRRLPEEQHEVAEGSAVGLERQADRGLDAIGQERDHRVGRRVDPQPGRGDQGAELRVPGGDAHRLAVEAADVGDAHGRTVGHRAEPRSRPEERLAEREG